MEESSFLKLVPFPKKEIEKSEQYSDPLFRFSRVVLSLTSNALDCLHRVAQREAKKASPSCELLEEYYLLNHYLDFIKRMCRDKTI